MFSFFKRKPDYVAEIAALLAHDSNKEELLGVKPPVMPTPNTIRKDANRLTRYSDSEDYKRFADEAWSRVVSDLDVIMNSKTSSETVAYHRGSLSRTLDLLRVSYQARQLLLQLDTERETSSQS